MKKRRITYGISGLMECQVVIKIGNKSKMKVLFTDGSMTAMGINPATYTTDDFIIQHAIEQSSDYKRGRINRVNVIELNEEVNIESNGNAESLKTANEDLVSPTESHTQSANDSNARQNEGGESEEKQAELKFSDYSEAKDFLADNYGVSRNSMRSPKQIIEQGLKQGVTIIIEE